MSWYFGLLFIIGCLVAFNDLADRKDWWRWLLWLVLLLGIFAMGVAEKLLIP